MKDNEYETRSKENPVATSIVNNVQPCRLEHTNELLTASDVKDAI